MTAEPRRLNAWLAFAILVAGVVASTWPIATRTHFVFDDYRYLNAIREADAGDANALLEATIVENRWDNHWWIPEGTYIRFFRPFVVASYWLDERIFGLNPAGFTLSNVALHLACVWLVFVLLRRLLARWSGPRVPDASVRDWAALAGALLFAVQACHTEQLWYIAGRTDTQAAFLFLNGLVAWVVGRRGWMVGALFFLMLVAKEYTLLFLGIVLLIERWLPTEPWSGWSALLRREAPRLAACGVGLALFLCLRWWALGEAGSGVKPFPYFFLPDREGFAVRTFGIGLDYANALVTGRYLSPFTYGLDEVVARNGWWRIVPSGVALLAFLGLSLRTAPGRIGAASFVLLLAPMLPLYSTGRYLYLPTVGLALAFAACLLTWRPRAALWFAVACIVSQAWMSQSFLQRLSTRPDVQTPPQYFADLLGDGHFDLSADAPPCFLVDFPMNFGGDTKVPLGWLGMQFVRDALEVQLGHDAPELYFISAVPANPDDGLALVERRGAGFALVRPRGALYATDPKFDFEQRLVTEGERWEERGFTIEILREANGIATAIEIWPTAKSFQVGVFVPLPDGSGWHTRGLPSPDSQR